MHRLTFIIFHDHMIPGGVAQFCVYRQLIGFRLIKGVLRVNINHYAQIAQ